ncbi:MAG: tRNA (N(6)-L-threonylcarbamoyladenosine(37)-C(2))-methylthiotransferase MtaB [Desulfuromonadales bacterium]
MTLTAAIATLGCKTNQFESAALHESLETAGYRIVPFEAGADLVVVNTCTVTAATDAQSRNLVRRARRLNAACRVVVTGCYAQVDPTALKELPGVALVLGNEEKRDLLRHLADGAGVAVAPSRATTALPPPLSTFAGRSRAFVQIQNGCDAFCSYCIIPYARGASRSVPAAAVIEQIRRLNPDYPEIVLTGIHIGGYGADLQPPTTLLALLHTIERETEVQRLRLGSLEPTEIPAALIETVAASPVLCPHFHIPLQAGDDAVLQRMNRHYDSAFFRTLVTDIHARLPEAAIGLDVIAGFPGETEAEFANTCQLIEDLPVSHLHVFPFSKRPGTPAGAMADQISGSLIKQRAARLRQIGEAKQAAFARRFIGRTLEVVIEGGKRKGLCRGLTGNYLSVAFSGGDAKEGDLVAVRITDWTSAGLLGAAV